MMPIHKPEMLKKGNIYNYILKQVHLAFIIYLPYIKILVLLNIDNPKIIAAWYF